MREKLSGAAQTQRRARVRHFLTLHLKDGLIPPLWMTRAPFPPLGADLTCYFCPESLQWDLEGFGGCDYQVW